MYQSVIVCELLFVYQSVITCELPFVYRSVFVTCELPFVYQLKCDDVRVAVPLFINVR